MFASFPTFALALCAYCTAASSISPTCNYIVLNRTAPYLQARATDVCYQETGGSINILKKYECVDDDTVLEHSYLGSLDCSQPLSSVVHKNGINASIHCGGSSCFTFVGFGCESPLTTAMQPIPLNVCAGGVYCRYCASETIHENFTDSDSFCELYAPTDVECLGSPLVTAYFDGQCQQGTLPKIEERISLQILRLAPGILEDEDEPSECLAFELETTAADNAQSSTTTKTADQEIGETKTAKTNEDMFIGIGVGVGCALLLVVLVYTVVTLRKKNSNDAHKHFYKSEDNLDYEVLLEPDAGNPQSIDNTIHGI